MHLPKVDRAKLEAEIEALQKQAQETQLAIFKIEGALQFAHHLLAHIDKPADEAPVAAPDAKAGKPPTVKASK